jgi:hypothetical protein
MVISLVKRCKLIGFVLLNNKKNNYERTKRQKNQSIQRMEKEL